MRKATLFLVFAAITIWAGTVALSVAQQKKQNTAPGTKPAESANPVGTGPQSSETVTRGVPSPKGGSQQGANAGVANDGMPTGKRQHKPVAITKEKDSASPSAALVKPPPHDCGSSGITNPMDGSTTCIILKNNVAAQPPKTGGGGGGNSGANPGTDGTKPVIVGAPISVDGLEHSHETVEYKDGEDMTTKEKVTIRPEHHDINGVAGGGEENPKEEVTASPSAPTQKPSTPGNTDRRTITVTILADSGSSVNKGTGGSNPPNGSTTVDPMKVEVKDNAAAQPSQTGGNSGGTGGSNPTNGSTSVITNPIEPSNTSIILKDNVTAHPPGGKGGTGGGNGGVKAATDGTSVYENFDYKKRTTQPNPPANTGGGGKHPTAGAADPVCRGCEGASKSQAIEGTLQNTGGGNNNTGGKNATGAAAGDENPKEQIEFNYGNEAAKPNPPANPGGITVGNLGSAGQGAAKPNPPADTGGGGKHPTAGAAFPSFKSMGSAHAQETIKPESGTTAAQPNQPANTDAPSPMNIRTNVSGRLKNPGDYNKTQMHGAQTNPMYEDKQQNVVTPPPQGVHTSTTPISNRKDTALPAPKGGAGGAGGAGGGNGGLSKSGVENPHSIDEGVAKSQAVEGTLQNTGGGNAGAKPEGHPTSKPK